MKYLPYLHYSNLINRISDFGSLVAIMLVFDWKWKWMVPMDALFLCSLRFCARLCLELMKARKLSSSRLEFWVQCEMGYLKHSPEAFILFNYLINSSAIKLRCNAIYKLLFYILSIKKYPIRCFLSSFFKNF